MSENPRINSTKTHRTPIKTAQKSIDDLGVITRAGIKRLERTNSLGEPSFRKLAIETIPSGNTQTDNLDTDDTDSNKSYTTITIDTDENTEHTMYTNNAVLQMQQTMAATIPEFSGQNNPGKDDELTRFINIADSSYNALNKEEDKNTFNKLIRLRLTGEAFNRIVNRNLETYPEIKQLLLHMYRETNSLEELERRMLETKQTYGESLRNYGCRLEDALEKYKTGFKNKYNAKTIDQLYEKHLQTSIIKTFKKGLNNTILKEKIATSTSPTIDEIVKETEIIERMLTDTIPEEGSRTYMQTTQQYTSIPIIANTTTICNYCQQPGHTYDRCTTRILQETLTPNNYQPRYRPNGHNQNGRYQQREKYCSFCKTTKSHTFDECQNKLRQPRSNNQNQRPYNQQRPWKNYSSNYKQGPNNYQKPWNNYSQQQQPNYASYNQNQNGNGNQTGYYQPNNNYKPQPNYSHNGNGYQPPNNQQETQINQPVIQKNVTSQDLSDMLQTLKINVVHPGSGIQTDSNPENYNGSSAN